MIFRHGTSVRLQPIILFLIVIFCLDNTAMAASCTWRPGNNMYDLIINFGDITLDVPRDAPDGTILFKKVMGSVPKLQYSCDALSNFGVKPNYAYSDNSSSSRFPIRETGLSWFIITDKTGEEMSPYDIGTSSATGIINLAAATYTLGIVKTGPIQTGRTSINGFLGTVKRGNLDLVRFDIRMHLYRKELSCSTPNVQVDMGTDHELNAIKNGVPPPVAFSLNLLNCPKSIKAVSYTLKANTAIIDSAKGVVALGLDSTAKGLGLQLLNEHSQPITFNKNQVFSGYRSDLGGDYKIPFYAGYYRILGKPLEAGTANSSISFIMTYL